MTDDLHNETTRNTYEMWVGLRTIVDRLDREAIHAKAKAADAHQRHNEALHQLNLSVACPECKVDRETPCANAMTSTTSSCYRRTQLALKIGRNDQQLSGQNLA